MAENKNAHRVQTTRIKNERYKKNKYNFNMLHVSVLCCLILAIAVLSLVLTRPAKSEMEHRELAKFPEFTWESYFSGEFTTAVSEYFRDTVPCRDALMTAENYLMSVCGIKEDNVTFHGNISMIDDSTGTTETAEPVTAAPITVPSETAAAEAPADTSVQTIESAAESTTHDENSYDLSKNYDDDTNGDIAEFTHNGIVVIDNTGLMLFGGNNTQGTRYANIINNYKDMLGSDVNVYNLVTPTSAEFWLPAKYSKYSASEKDCIDNIYANLAPDVTSVDAYSVLEQHKDEYIFFRTDHHWTPLGAYYAYTAFCDALGMEARPLEEYEHKIKENFVGSLYGYSSDVTLNDNPDQFNYYIPPDNFTTNYYDYKTLADMGTGVLFHEYAEGSNCYGMFLGSDAIHTKIVTEHKNGRKIIVFKESFGNAFVPFLVSNFEEIYVVDIRYFGTNAVDYIKENGITDVLFIDNIFAANTSSLIDGIELLRTNPTGTITE